MFFGVYGFGFRVVTYIYIERERETERERGFRVQGLGFRVCMVVMHRV